MKKLILFLLAFPLIMHSQYINGPLGTGTLSASGVAAPSGDEWSEVQNETGNTTYSNTLAGVSCSVTTTVFRCADDFEVPAGETWTISHVVTFAYQTGYAGGSSPIVAATLQIWDGVPGATGSTVIFGNETTNRLLSSNDTGMWRIFNSMVPAPGAAPATNRKIWNNYISVTPPIALTEGTYWIDWNTQISANGAHFVPPVTIPGVRTLPGMNARQFTATGWVDVIDVGNPEAEAPDVPMDFPFQLLGSFMLNCDEPENLAVNTITETTAEISWDAQTNDTEGYNWLLMADGEDPFSDVPFQDGNVVSGVTSLTLTGLDDDTTYDFYVQTDCDTTQSGWAGPLVFTTQELLGNSNHTIIGFKHYPNPAENSIFISADENIERAVIFNVLGQRVLNQLIESNAAELDISILSTGYYFIEISTKVQTGIYRFLKE